jgi:glucose/arabinose dehydrogenase
MILALSIVKYAFISFMKKILWLLVFSLTACVQCKKTDKKNINPSPGSVTLKETVLVQSLNFPWEVLWGPDNFIWMTERGGRISRVNPATGTVIPLLTIAEVVTNNEGGMLGMVLHPDFSATPQVFVAYDYNNANGYREKIVSYTYN